MFKMAEATSKERFEAAVNVIKELPQNGPFQPSDDILLKFYAYYKQATVGRCNIAKPWALNVVKKAKWPECECAMGFNYLLVACRNLECPMTDKNPDVYVFCVNTLPRRLTFRDAWNNMGNMSCEEARNNYVNELKKIIETMPQTATVTSFMDKIGQFYELVEDGQDDQESPLNSASSHRDMSTPPVKKSTMENGDDLQSGPADISFDIDLHMMANAHQGHTNGSSHENRNLGQMLISGDSNGLDADCEPEFVAGGYREGYQVTENSPSVGQGFNRDKLLSDKSTIAGEHTENRGSDAVEKIVTFDHRVSGGTENMSALEHDERVSSEVEVLPIVDKGDMSETSDLSDSEADEFCDTSDHLPQGGDVDRMATNQSEYQTFSSGLYNTSPAKTHNTISTTALIHNDAHTKSTILSEGKANVLDTIFRNKIDADLVSSAADDNVVCSSVDRTSGRVSATFSPTATSRGVANGGALVSPVPGESNEPSRLKRLVDYRSSNEDDRDSKPAEIFGKAPRFVYDGRDDPLPDAYHATVMQEGYRTRTARGGQMGGDGNDRNQKQPPDRNQTTPPAPWAGETASSSRRRAPLQQGGAGGHDGDDSTPQSNVHVNQQISTALMRLQQDMNGIIVRLDSLEYLARQSQISSDRGNADRPPGISNWLPRWLRPFVPSASPSNVLFMLVWPFLVHWIMIYAFKRRRRRDWESLPEKRMQQKDVRRPHT